MKEYQKPNLEIIVINQNDVVCSSLLNGIENGDGDFGHINDWL